jgi:hypothetical protein
MFFDERARKSSRPFFYAHRFGHLVFILQRADSAGVEREVHYPAIFPRLTELPIISPAGRPVLCSFDEQV